MSQRTFSSIHEMPRFSKQILNTELTEQIFTYILKLLRSDDLLSIFSAAWCIAWSGYNEKDIVPHDLIPAIATRLVDLWINTPSSSNLKRTISWALYCICMPNLEICKSKALFEAIESSYNKANNDYDRFAAIHLAALTNYWEPSKIRHIINGQKTRHIKALEESRFLTELGVLEK